MLKKKLFASALIVFVFGSSLVLSGCLQKAPASGPVSLTIYGLDDSDVLDPIISKYKEKNPSVSVKYKKFNDEKEFENMLINEIAEGEGPDVFYLHNTWLPRHLKKIVPLTSESLTTQNFSQYFVNVTGNDFIQPDPKDGLSKIYALPLYVDTLALYYNKTDFEQKLPERGKPASNWDVFKEDASKLRKQAEDGKLEKGAIALGRTDNIRLGVDILYNLFLQAGVEFYDADFKQTRFAGSGQEVFDYFLSFANQQNKNFSWNTDLVMPTQPLGEVEAFLAGKVSAILGYSELYQRLETELKNVKTRSGSTISMKEIAVMPIPQVATQEADYKVWADYYGLAVSRNSKNPTKAWGFVQFAASKDSAKTYHQKTKRPTARRDLIEDQKKEPIIDVFVSQLGYAGSFRIFSSQKFAEVLNKAVADAGAGKTSSQALGEAQTTINDMLKLEVPNGMYPKPKIIKKK